MNDKEILWLNFTNVTAITGVSTKEKRAFLLNFSLSFRKLDTKYTGLDLMQPNLKA